VVSSSRKTDLHLVHSISSISINSAPPSTFIPKISALTQPLQSKQRWPPNPLTNGGQRPPSLSPRHGELIALLQFAGFLTTCCLRVSASASLALSNSRSSSTNKRTLYSCAYDAITRGGIQFRLAELKSKLNPAFLGEINAVVKSSDKDELKRRKLGAIFAVYGHVFRMRVLVGATLMCSTSMVSESEVIRGITPQKLQMIFPLLSRPKTKRSN
jgi:hypothetical protein